MTKKIKAWSEKGRYWPRWDCGTPPVNSIYNYEKIISRDGKITTKNNVNVLEILIESEKDR